MDNEKEYRLRYTNGMWIEVPAEMYNKDEGIFAKISSYYRAGLHICLGKYPPEEHEFLWVINFILQTDSYTHGEYVINCGSNTEEYIMQQMHSLLPSLVNFLYERNITTYNL